MAPRELLAPFGIAAILLSACGEDLGRPLGLDEQRTFLASPQQIVRQTFPPGEFHISTPVGMQPNRLTLAGRDQLLIGQGVEIRDGTGGLGAQQYGIIASFGELQVGEGATVGSIYGFGDARVVLAPRSVVKGYIKASGVTKSPRAVVTYGMLENVDRATEDFSWSVDFSQSGARAATIHAAARSENVAPGRYSRLVVERNARAVLRAGEYRIDSLVVEKDATLELNNASGPLYLWIRDELELRGSMLEYYLSSNILLGYSGTRSPVIETTFVGTLVAPNASVPVPARDEPHRASFHAKSVIVADGAIVSFTPFITNALPREAASDCAKCLTDARREQNDCCARLETSRAATEASESVCRSACTTKGVDSDCAAGCAQASAQWSAAERLLESCGREVEARASKCEVDHLLRPETCSRLGFAHFERFICR